MSCPRRCAALAALVALAVGPVTGCSSSAPPTVPTGPLSSTPGSSTPAGRAGSAWRPEALPEGTEVVTLTVVSGRLLAGAARPRPAATSGSPAGPDGVLSVGQATQVEPELYTRDPGLSPTGPAAGGWQPLAVTARTGYGRTTTWLSVQPDGSADAAGGLVAVGGTRGGAHANVRWTVWRGSVAHGLREQEQSFATFGGWGAGDQLGVLSTAAGPMLLGTWESATTGQDGALWLPDGPRWVRRDSTGTALASTRAALVGPHGGTGWGAGALVVGSLVLLGDGVRQIPAAWRSAHLDTGWRAVALPAQQPGEALGVTCRATAAPAPDPAGIPGAAACLVTGRVAGRLALWSVFADGSVVAQDAPDIAVPERDPMAPPVWVEDPPDSSAAAGSTTRPATLSAAVLVTEIGTGRSVLVRQGPSGRWVATVGPEGAAGALVAAGGRLWALTTMGEGGGSRLWSLSTRQI